jgi:hypothetical protein
VVKIHSISTLPLYDNGRILQGIEFLLVGQGKETLSDVGEGPV